MFKSIYTTRMSDSSKALGRRFDKITAKPMRFGRLTAFVCTVFLTITIALSTFVLAQIDDEIVDYQIEITNKGEVIELVNKPFVENNTIYVPLREFFTKMGFMDHPEAKMEWDSGVVLISLYERNTKKGVETEYTGYCYKIEIGKSELVINPGEIVPLAAQRGAVVTEQMQSEPILVNNTTYVPYEYVQRIVERADNGIMSYPARYTLNVLYTGESFSIAYPFKEVYNVSQKFGTRVHPITGEEKFHTGIDFDAPEGTPVIAGIEGRRTSVGFDEEKGAYMTIANESGVEITYCHLKSDILQMFWNTDWVAKGSNIAEVGNTGMSTGAHLHMEVKINGEYVNPEDYLENTMENELMAVIGEQMPRTLSRLGLEGYEYSVTDIEFDEHIAGATVQISLKSETDEKLMKASYMKMSDEWGWIEMSITEE